MSTDVLRRMEKTMNSHDLDAFADCFTEDFRSVLPLHPERSFTGRAQMRSNWAALFAHVPDLVGTVLQSVVDGDQVWSEWEIVGTTVEGEPYLSRGVVILRPSGERIASVRFYLENADADAETGSVAGAPAA
ncbi:nuclear transport factor 2 family protein [Streptomyces iconiensis]|uniref:Nuclear transport factor 2 family protein n=1 Tax=Streptomyces iconiensis TaxID=1384038 RepID=A0ABT6ZVQ4_9ACTN|nr:nuclear transport factor 2 family protein [Streptomyces iconiensis]MDJ1132864.1 nuclear transport factor 2 family protein [Streptomyces iconiensis]